MSTSTKRPLNEVKPIALELRDLLAPHTAWIAIAGSVRRNKPMVSDVEIVAHKSPTLWAALDDLVGRGVVSRWKDAHGKERWNGKKYRALVYKGVHVDIFTADHWNRGYQFWLRTGPGDANQFLVTRVKNHNAPFKIQGGYIYDTKDNRLMIPDEAAFWNLLNFPTLAPDERSIQRYKEIFKWHSWKRPQHTIQVQTGRIDYRDDDTLNITVKDAATFDEKLFAPTWDMLNAHRAGEITWDTYVERYLDLMRERYRESASQFHKLLKRDRLVLTCYCNKPQCHRRIAVYVLARIAEQQGIRLLYQGEVSEDKTVRQMTLF